jgi:hypothetical protein
MAKKKRAVHCKITFDENGNVIKVQGNDKDVQGSPLSDNPIHGVIGTAMVVITADDDPCVVQGNTKYCW